MTYALHNEEKKICTMIIDTHFDKREREKGKRGIEGEY
jgi:hypothetical protein